MIRCLNGSVVLPRAVTSTANKGEHNDVLIYRASMVFVMAD